MTSSEYNTIWWTDLHFLFKGFCNTFFPWSFSGMFFWIECCNLVLIWGFLTWPCFLSIVHSFCVCGLVERWLLVVASLISRGISLTELLLLNSRKITKIHVNVLVIHTTCLQWQHTPPCSSQGGWQTQFKALESASISAERRSSVSTHMPTIYPSVVYTIQCQNGLKPP